MAASAQWRQGMRRFSGGTMNRSDWRRHRAAIAPALRLASVVTIAIVLSRYSSANESVAVDAGHPLSPHEHPANPRQVFLQKLHDMSPALKPPATYVAIGACPFECCTYRTWTVNEDVTLVDREHGTKVVGVARKGASVEGITGNLSVSPIPAGVLVDEPPLKAGDLFFILDYTGEGLYRYWFNGKVADDEVGQWDEGCKDECPVVFLEPLKPGHMDWWVKVRMKDGVVGWTNKTERFDHMDACE
jgi:hypothetical protein